MGKYLKEFQTLAEYKDFKNSPDYIEPNTSWVVENTTVYHNYDKYEDEVKNEADEKISKFSSEYMFFEAIEDCRFWLTDTENRFQYSFDKSEWVYLPHDAATPKVAAGDKIYIKCFGPLISGDEGIGQFESSGKFNVKGNIMSLLYGDDFVNKTDLTGESFVFSALFANNTNLISAEELVLPAEKLSVGCYQSMFKGCTKLLSAPSLPAVTLAKYCYGNMFQNCFELSNAPELPVTTLEPNCYMNMFNGCASIVASPLLPASVLVESCYSGMFYNCSSLKEITMLATDISATDCLGAWVDGVAPEGTFYRNPEMDLLVSGVDGIPEGWTLVPGYQKPNDDESDLEDDTILNEYFSFDAIEDGTFSFSQNDIMYNLNGNGWNVLPAGKTTPLVSAGSRIYFKATNPKITNVEHEVPLGTISTKGGIGRFSATGKFDVRGNIMSLLYGDEFMGNIDLTGKSDVFYALFYNCTKIVNANNLILPATTMSVYGYQAMFMGCSSLLTAPELPATTLADHCYESMFWGCNRLLETPVLPATTVAVKCYQYMFRECTAIKKACDLPAVTLEDSCYEYMFYGCSNLEVAPVISATKLAYQCCWYMFAQCKSLKSAPALLSETLVSYSYASMFAGCSNLNEIKMYATNASAYNCLSGWVSGVASEGIFYRNPEMKSLSRGSSGIPQGWTLIPGDEGEIDDKDIAPIDNYFALEALEDCTFSFNTDVNVLQYSLNRKEWNNLTVGASTPTVSAGSKIYFKATNPSITEEYGIGTFSSTGKFNASGNIMSLWYAENFAGKTVLEADYIFKKLFATNKGITDASNLVLPATTLSQGCYQNMFDNCENLVNAPELPATTLTNRCYDSMFFGCMSLVTVPKLHANRLADACYYYMFANCPNLIDAPELPATILANDCYCGMFYDCISLINAPELPSISLMDKCYNNMFNGCINLIKAPVLSASVLKNNCYENMFSGCSNLNEITMLATDASANKCLSEWVSGVASEGIFYRSPEMDSLPRGINGIPAGWTLIPGDEDVLGNYFTFKPLEEGSFSITNTTNNIYYKIGANKWILLPPNTSTPLVSVGDKISFKMTNPVIGKETGIGVFKATGRFDVNGNIMSLLYGDNFVDKTSMGNNATVFACLFKNNTYLINASNLVLPATSLTQSCYKSMFNGCTNLISTPELPATKIPKHSYWSMFEDCTSLITTPELPATSLGDRCYQNMFFGCTNLISVPELPATNMAPYCYHCMFQNCTSLTVLPALPATTLQKGCYSGIFAGCTSLTDASSLVLPAKKMVAYCYENMFDRCTNLINVPELPATTLAEYCYSGMFNHCAIAIAPELPALVMSNNCYLDMFRDCSNLNEIKMYATNIAANDCLDNWVDGVASTGTFYRNPEMNSLPIGVNGIPEGWTIVPPYDEEEDNDIVGYLSFEAIEDGTFSFTKNNIYYSLDEEIWHRLLADTSTPTVSAGSKIYFKASNPSIIDLYGIGTFSSTGRFNVSGNVMSMLYGDDFMEKTDLTDKGCAFCKLFHNCTNLVNASELILPATILASNCYQDMFYGCTSLTLVPELPATTLASYCYYRMFRDCTSLTTAPELPATQIEYACYQSMFYGCTGLISAPVLPATTLATDCYNQMFAYCTSLTSAPELPATTLASYCYLSMFFGCTSLVTAPELTVTTLAQSCYCQMFYGCTSLATAPELPATTLTYNCYGGMFRDCSNLNEIKMYATNIAANDCLENWVDGVAPEGTFYRNPEMTSLPTGRSGIPKGWTIIPPYDANEYLTFEAIEDGTFSFTQNAIQYSVDGTKWNDLAVGTSTPTVSAGSKIHFKATNPSITNSAGIGTFDSTGKFNVSGNVMSMLYGDEFVGKNNLAGKNSAFSYLFKNCTRLVDASELILSATTLTASCYASMFFGCTSLTDAPELPATTLAGFCYCNMFRGCTSLTTAPELPATTLAQDCYEFMFSGCKNLTTAPELPATTLVSWCYRDMFSGCSNLNEITMLATDISASYCLDYWVEGVAPIGTFYRNPEMTSLPIGVNGIPEGWTIVPPYDDDNGGDEPTDYASEYLTFEAIEDSTFSFTKNDIQYSLDKTTWKDLPAGTSTPTVNAGNKIYFWRSLVIRRDSDGIGTFSSTGRFNVSGNIMSMLAGNAFAEKINLSNEEYAFRYLFQNTKVVDASNLILPATTLADYCYDGMFKYCYYLKATPALPASALKESCYAYMFSGCTSLVNAPELPATTLADCCYGRMFGDCTSLVNAPELPAAILTKECYDVMFYGCSNLNEIKMYATNITAYNCLNNWVEGVAPTGTFYRNPEMNSLPIGVNGIPEGWTIVPPYDDDNGGDKPTGNANEYLTFEAIEDGTFSFTQNTIQYSVDGTNWNDLTVNTSTPTISAGSKIYFKASNPSIVEKHGIGTFSSTGRFNVSGNVMSMQYGDDFIGKTDLTGKDDAFSSLFRNCTGLVDASGLIIPATTLATYCYYEMFYGCTSLTLAPELPATTLANYCYQYMFSDCINLATAPALPATTLGISCYYHMFNGCTSLTTAPELPAITLEQHCYRNMFKGCTNLTTAPELPATTMVYSCYSGMFEDCTSLTTAPALPATTLATKLATSCYGSMFSGCTSLTTAPALPATTLTGKCYTFMFKNCTSLVSAPELPATTLAEYCYQSMFYGCTSLTSAPELPVKTLANYCYQYMFSGCTNLTSAPELPATTLKGYCYMSMFEGCTSLTSAPELPATTLADMCYQSMFSGCTSLATAPELPVTTLREACYSNMFKGCTSLTTAPELPATKLSSHCYYYMFSGCSNLNEITMLTTDISALNCLTNWVEGVASEGAFYRNPEMNSLPTGTSGIPEGWTVLDYNG